MFEGGLFSYGGGYFPFFTENRPQKHKKHAILHTSQANGGARAPPPPLATLLSIRKTFRSKHITAQTSPKKKFSPLEIFPRLPIRNKILKSYRMLLILNKCFALELLSKQSHGPKLLNCFSSECKPCFPKLNLLSQY